MAIIPDWLLVRGDSSKTIKFYYKSIDKMVRQKFANGVFWVCYVQLGSVFLKKNT